MVELEGKTHFNRNHAFFIPNRIHIFNLFVIVRMFVLLFSISNDESKTLS